AKALKKENLIIEAYDIVQQGLEMDDFNPELFFVAGQLAYQLDKIEESVVHIKHALALDQDFKPAILLLVNIYTSIDKHEAVIDLITNSKEAGGIDPLYDWELTKAYNKTKEYNKALKSYKKKNIGLKKNKEACAIEPLYDWELAKAYNETEQYKKALKSYKEASIGLQEDSEFLKEYGYFLVEEGLVQEAINILSKYMTLEPLDEEVIN